MDLFKKAEKHFQLISYSTVTTSHHLFSTSRSLW